MHHLLYFLAAVVLLVGLMYMAGYIGHPNQELVFTTTGNMGQIISNTSSSGSCDSCKWY